MKKRQIITTSEKETREMAKLLQRQLKGGEILALIGELGSGKTTFVKGLAKCLGIRQPVRSPSFLLMKVYPLRRQGKARFLVHFDAYRIHRSRDLQAIGAEEYLGRPDTICVLEWADRVPGLLRKYKKIIIFHFVFGGNINERKIKIKSSRKIF